MIGTCENEHLIMRFVRCKTDLPPYLFAIFCYITVMQYGIRDHRVGLGHKRSEGGPANVLMFVVHLKYSSFVRGCNKRVRLLKNVIYCRKKIIVKAINRGRFYTSIHKITEVNVITSKLYVRIMVIPQVLRVAPLSVYDF
jgi:hypothetical protein